jgi:DNA-binding response OmpR family regulator
MIVLLIDDDAALRKIMHRMIADAGHEVIEAADGVAGLRAFETKPADVVVTDIMMPEKEGIETIRDLRKLAPTLRIVAVSGGARIHNLDFLNMARQLGADATLPKPFRKEELLACIEGRSAGRRTL